MLRARVVGILEHGALGVGARGYGNHVRRVLDRHNYPSCELNLLPGLLNVDDVESIGAAAKDVLVHPGKNGGVVWGGREVRLLRASDEIDTKTGPNINSLTCDLHS